VQLDGGWVSLIWAIEAAVLFSIGRTKAFPIYETISYVLVCLAFVSLLQDMTAYYDYLWYESTPHHAFLLNGQFLTSLVALVSFALIYWLNQREEFKPPMPRESQTNLILTLGIGMLTLFVAYFMFYKEIESFWVQRHLASHIIVPAQGDLAQTDLYDDDIERFGTLWLINYSAGFCIILSFALLRFSIRDFFRLQPWAQTCLQLWCLWFWGSPRFLLSAKATCNRPMQISTREVRRTSSFAMCVCCLCLPSYG